MKNILFLIFAIVIPFSVFAQAPQGKGYQLIYEEVFKGDTLNTNDWVYREVRRDGQKSTPLPFRAHIEFELDKDGWFRDGFEYTPEGIIFYDNGKEVAKCDWHELTANQMIWLTALNGVGKFDTLAQPGETVFKYFRYYAKDYPGINLLPNGNFEFNSDRVDSFKPVSWSSLIKDDAIEAVESNTVLDNQ